MIERGETGPGPGAEQLEPRTTRRRPIRAIQVGASDRQGASDSRLINVQRGAWSRSRGDGRDPGPERALDHPDRAGNISGARSSTSTSPEPQALHSWQPRRRTSRDACRDAAASSRSGAAMRRAPGAWGRPGSGLVPPGVVASLRAEGAGVVGCQCRSTPPRFIGTAKAARPHASRPITESVANLIASDFCAPRPIRRSMVCLHPPAGTAQA